MVSFSFYLLNLLPLPVEALVLELLHVIECCSEYLESVSHWHIFDSLDELFSISEDLLLVSDDP
jgi:hypothetical protein